MSIESNKLRRSYWNERKAFIQSKSAQMNEFYDEFFGDYQKDHGHGVGILNELEPRYTCRFAFDPFDMNKIDPLIDDYLTKFEKLAIALEPHGFVRLKPDNFEIMMQALDEATRKAHLVASEDMNLKKLAHVGLALEVGSHDFNATVMRIKDRIAEIPEARLQDSLKTDFDMLVNNFRGLMDLRVSGIRGSAFTGQDIVDFIERQYGRYFESNGIEFVTTAAFTKLKFWQDKSTLYSAFLNLVANAYYWVDKGGPPRKTIRIGVQDGVIYVSDTGPGVDRDKIGQLFTPFFSERHHGRGVGLILVQQNLAMQDATIAYSTDVKPLPGANFAITFKSLQS